MTREIRDPGLRLRAERAASLCLSLQACDQVDAAALCAAFLDDVSAGAPDIAVHADVRTTARLWADWAHPLELEATCAAALSRLGNAPLGIHSRKRMFKALWQSFPDADRRAFLARVDADGRFHGKAAA